MSIYGPNQVEEVIIGNAVASETTLATFIATASDKEIKILSADGSAPASGVDFKIFQKSAGVAAKGLNYEFSDVIGASNVEEVILKTYVAETLKSVVVSSFDAPAANTSYAVEIRLFQDGGTLSPENFAVITGYYNIGSIVPAIAVVIQGLADSLNANLTKRGGGEAVVTNDATTLTISALDQAVVLGKIVGRPVEFDVTAKLFLETSVNHENISSAVVTVTEGNPGVGTAKYARNLEWFTKGYKYDAYRQTGFPADFTERVPVYASVAGVYNVIHIKYKSSRISPTLEEQPRVLTIFIDKVSDDLANNAETNSVLDDLQLILGAANVPSDLSLA
jgi:hypothetical protein